MLARWAEGRLREVVRGRARARALAATDLCRAARAGAPVATGPAESDRAGVWAASRGLPVAAAVLRVAVGLCLDYGSLDQSPFHPSMLKNC